MATKAELEGLLAAVEKASGPDREIDANVSELLLGLHIKRERPNRQWRHGNRGGKWSVLPPYTDSIDAAVALLERVLPGWSFCLTSTRFCNAELWLADEHGLFGPKYPHVPSTDGKTLPLAICVATLRALISQSDEASK